MSFPLTLDELRFRQRLARRYFEWLDAGQLGVLTGIPAAAALLLSPLGRLIEPLALHWQILIPVLLIVLCYLAFLAWLDTRRLFRLAGKDGQRAQRLMSLVQDGLSKTEAVDLLREIYKPEVRKANADLERRGLPALALSEHYAAIFSRAVHSDLRQIICSDGGEIDLKNILCPAINAEERQEVIRKARSTNNQSNDTESGDNYCLAELAAEQGQYRLRLGVARYGDILRTSDCLIEEWGLFCALIDGLHFGRDQALRCLPWRRKVLRAEGANAFLRPQARFAGLGISACTVVECPGEKSAGGASYRVFHGLRSDSVGTYPHKWHVVPSGMCNTRNLRLSEDYLAAALQAEFLEEVFNKEQFEGLVQNEWMSRVTAEMSTLLHGAKDGAAFSWSAEATGICFDLMNMRPEVCILIRLDNGFYEFHKEKIKFNFEYAANVDPQLALLANKEERRQFVPDEWDGKARPKASHWVQSGAVALMLALERLEGKQRRI